MWDGGIGRAIFSMYGWEYQDAWPSP